MTEVASKVGDKLESTADKITSKIPGGEGLKNAASDAIEKGVNKIGAETKEMVEKGKGYVNNKVDQGQAATAKKSGSILGEISDKIQQTAEQGVGAVTGAVGQAGNALGAGVNMAQDAAKQ